jgi:Fe-S-cluster containining protein
VTFVATNKTPWYVGGLHFECAECGRCCSGPSEGYIWVTKPEIKLIADFLKISIEQLRQKYLKRVGLRRTIIEQTGTKDCIFLQRINDSKKCIIYSVRPTQCRAWPFWPDNLASASAWNNAAQKCQGINQGKHYSFAQIQKIKKIKQWWKNAEQTDSS